MIKFVRDCLASLLFGLILLFVLLVLSLASARGASLPFPSRRVFVGLAIATVAGNIADAELTAYKLRTTPDFIEHDPLYGRRPSRAALWGWECAGATAAILVAYEMRRHHHVRLAMMPLTLTIGSSVFWVQHNARWGPQARQSHR
jgi:hypothetical protein